jgi:uncharacterized protein YrrD
MTLAGSIEGAALRGADGVTLGTVVRVLFHPAGPRAIGLMVRGPSIYGIVERGDTFLPLTAVRFESDAVTCALAKLPKGRAAADRLGFDPDATVIWTGMPVLGPSGDAIGTVSDVEFDAESGVVTRLEVAGGAVADAAHGRFVVPGEMVEGYRDGAVRIGAEASQLETSGGLAKAAARATVAASETAKSVGKAAETVLVEASRATGRAVKAARDGQVAEKAVHRVKRTWRDTVAAFREGKDGDDES